MNRKSLIIKEKKAKWLAFRGTGTLELGSRP
jgi:hypothetical protein